MQDVKSTTIHSRSFDERTLTKSCRSIIHTLVVNLPMNKSTTCQKIVLQEVAPHSKREEKKPRQELRMYLSQESKLCYDKMRRKHPLFI
jgi:hypothetical protein